MKKPSPCLTFAGAIPFVVCAVFITLGIDAVIGLGKTVEILAAYGLVIASFMAGAHWGNHLSLADDDAWALKLPIFSNIIAVLLWLGFLSLPDLGFIWLLVVGFISLLVIDMAQSSQYHQSTVLSGQKVCHFDRGGLFNRIRRAIIKTIDPSIYDHACDPDRYTTLRHQDF